MSVVWNVVRFGAEFRPQLIFGGKEVINFKAQSTYQEARSAAKEFARVCRYSSDA